MIPLIRLTTSFAALVTLGAVSPHPAAAPVHAGGPANKPGHASAARSLPTPTCDDLTTVTWSGFVLDDVVAIEATPTDPAHCRVRGTIDTEIHFELLLPLPAEWNGRFLMGGGGGYVGSVQNQALGYLGSNSVLTRGFATVGTDTGHRGVGTDASWALNRPDREVNFGHRAVHVTAETAKTIIRIYYGRDIDYSYFLGCSRGGGQGMMASQRYPDDFDGIVAGAPAHDWTALGALFLQTQQALYPDPADLTTPMITDEAARTIETAILEACDENDGVADGIMTNPLECDIDLAAMPGLTADQRRAAEVIYGGAHVGGRHKTAGGRLILWTGWSDAAIPATGTIRYFEGVAAGDDEVDDYLRMFMLPGVLHCGGGPGPDQVDMQRPVCAWPAEAVYKGSGDPKREENFECEEPRR